MPDASVPPPDAGFSADAGVDAGSRESFTLPQLGQRVFSYLRTGSFGAFYDTLVATSEEIRAACPSRAGLDAYFSSGEGSRTQQQAAFDACRGQIDFARATFTSVRDIAARPLLVPPECPRSVNQSQLQIDVSVDGRPFRIEVEVALELGASWRVYSRIGSCGALDNDGGEGPAVAISAAPNPGMVGQATQFTASISGGTAPYTACSVRFASGQASAPGTLSSSSCSASHTYSVDGDYTVQFEVTDSGGKIGQGLLSYRVDPLPSTDKPDLLVRPGTVSLVDPPSENRYPRGAQVKVRFTAKNVGNGDAPASSVAILLRDPVTLAETLVETTPLAALPSLAEMQMEVPFTIPAAQPTAVYDLIIDLDSAGAIDETAEGNNRYVFLWVTVSDS